MFSVKVSLRGREKPWSRIVRTGPYAVEEVVAGLGMNPLEVLIKLNGEFVPDTQKVRKGDEMELLEITSRG